MNARRLMLLATLLAFPFLMPSLANDPASAKNDPADEQAIRDAVDKYFRGVVQADKALIEQAWHTEGTRMIYVKSLGIPEPRFETVSIHVAMDWWTRVKAKSSSGEILYGEMALVKFDFHFEHIHYIDYLTLLKLKEGWKIVNKSFVRIMPDKGAPDEKEGEADPETK